VFQHRVEYGEESVLVPSHLFYLSGCDLRCVFCIAELDAFDPSRGAPLTADYFCEAVALGREQGARNIQWSGGEATIHIPAILEVMSTCRDLPPVVWKSDFHGTPEALALLEGVVETYVADFKFGNDACARRLCGIEGYWEIVTRNLKLAARQARLIVRHLLLPGHVQCCFSPIVQWMMRELPEAPLSLRVEYLPFWRAGGYNELTRPLSPQEAAEARHLAEHAGIRMIQ
jgi:putative pyruvate formate lyase activating enzyme